MNTNWSELKLRWLFGLLWNMYSMQANWNLSNLALLFLQFESEKEKNSNKQSILSGDTRWNHFCCAITAMLWNVYIIAILVINVCVFVHLIFHTFIYYLLNGLISVCLFVYLSLQQYAAEQQFIQTTDSLVATRISLKLQLQSSHFHGSPPSTTGGLTLRCIAEIPNLYYLESSELELGAQPRDPVPARGKCACHLLNLNIHNISIHRSVWTVYSMCLISYNAHFHTNPCSCRLQ